MVSSWYLTQWNKLFLLEPQGFYISGKDGSVCCAYIDTILVEERQELALCYFPQSVLQLANARRLDSSVQGCRLRQNRLRLDELQAHLVYMGYGSVGRS